MKFERDKQFDTQFDKVNNLRWYPYVGKHFGENGARIMVYAHNIPIQENIYDERKEEWAEKAVWADAMHEYTYVQAEYTNSFRCFIKGAVGLQRNYSENGKPPTEPSIIQRVDAFVERIAYLNFIQDLVKSDKALGTRYVRANRRKQKR